MANERTGGIAGACFSGASALAAFLCIGALAGCRQTCMFHNGRATQVHIYQCAEKPGYVLRTGKTGDDLTVEYWHGDVLACAAYFCGPRMETVLSQSLVGGTNLVIGLAADTNGYRMKRTMTSSNTMEYLFDSNGDGFPETGTTATGEGHFRKKLRFRWTCDELPAMTNSP
jgi:hypothetical protein